LISFETLLWLIAGLAVGWITGLVLGVVWTEHSFEPIINVYKQTILALSDKRKHPSISTAKRGSIK
jgi:hypothetical protein